MKQFVFAILAAMVLVATARAAPPEAASVTCYFFDGSVDFTFDYAASDKVVALDRDVLIATYTINARVPVGDSIIVVGALPPPSESTVALVIGADARAHFFRDGRLVDEKRCELAS